MHILIIADVYPPEVSSAANLMKELAGGFLNIGDDVTMVTSYPRHYLRENKKGISVVSEENGIRVIRVKTLPLHNVNFIIRGISQLILPFLFFTKIKKYINKKIDAVIVYSPPLPLGIVGKMVKNRYGAKFVLNVQDIFPQNAIDLGILRNKLLIELFEKMEQYVYKNADAITFNSEGGRKFLIEKKNVPEQKISTLLNWVNISEYQKFKNTSFREKYGLENKFIFLFAGVMGPAQGLRYVIDIAERVADLDDIAFLFVGEGTEKENIKKLVKEKSISNVYFQSFVSKEEYPALVSNSDVGIVCLSAENKTPFLPGKFQGYMAAAKPIVAFLNKESDGFNLIEKATCGYAACSDNIEEGEKIVRKIFEERGKIDELGENGFKYAKENLSLEGAVEKFCEIIRK